MDKFNEIKKQIQIITTLLDKLSKQSNIIEGLDFINKYKSFLEGINVNFKLEDLGIIGQQHQNILSIKSEILKKENVSYVDKLTRIFSKNNYTPLETWFIEYEYEYIILLINLQLYFFN